MFNIVASDLDGTLLSPDNRLLSFTKQTLRLVTERGINFVFATGRHYLDVVRIRDELGIGAYMITSNGACVHNIKGELIYSNNLDRKIASKLCDIVYNDADICTNVFRYDEWFISKSTSYCIGFFGGLSFHNKIYHQGMLPSDGICKVYFTSDNHKKLLLLERMFHALWGSQINISFSLPMCLEVMSGGVSKGKALKQVAELLGYKLHDCISFGDGMNDKEMLSMTGKGCIMSNAHQRLKDNLPFLEIIGSNKNESVAHYLKNMYLDVN